MRATDILAAMRKGGETLCMGHGRDGPEHWLHPSRVMVASGVAASIKQLPGVEPGKDGLAVQEELTNRGSEGNVVIFPDGTLGVHPPCQAEALQEALAAVQEPKPRMVKPEDNQGCNYDPYVDVEGEPLEVTRRRGNLWMMDEAQRYAEKIESYYLKNPSEVDEEIREAMTRVKA